MKLYFHVCSFFHLFFLDVVGKNAAGHQLSAPLLRTETY